MEGRNSSVQEDASTVPVIITHEFLRASQNNDAPLQETLQAARERREEAIAKTADIAAQIRELQAQQRALAQEIARHKSDVLVYDRVLAPIRRVPPDILREIARHALPLHPYPSLTESPLSLSHVSSAWRKAVLSSAVLWDILVLYFKEADSRSFKRADRMAKEWFSRAKARHLTLFVKADFDSEDDPSAPRTFRRFLSNLSARVHHLAFRAPRVGDLLSTLIDGTLSWPNLRTLEFIEKEWLNWTQGHGPPPLLSTFQTAQSLRRVRMNYKFGPGTSAERLLPWGSLTHIVLTSWMSVDMWWDILRWCSCLQIGEFAVENLSSESTPEDQVRFVQGNLTHPDLQSIDLTVCSYNESMIGMLFPYTFPKLTNLSFSVDERCDDQSPWAPETCVKSFKMLRSLALGFCWIGDNTEYTLEMLRELVHLSELTVGFVDTTDDADHNCDPAVFVAMTVTDSGDFILPNLTSLRVSFQGSYNLEYTTIFTNMLLSRVRPMGVSERMQLVEFSAYYGKKGNRQLRSALSTIGEQGILLRWHGATLLLPQRGPIFDSVFTSRYRL